MDSLSDPGPKPLLPRIIVTRHAAAMAWALSDFARRGWRCDRAIFHANMEDLCQPADVYGILPAQMAAAVCQAGGYYHHLAIDVPRTLRGAEMDVRTFLKLRPRWERFVVVRSGSDHDPICPRGAH